MVWPCALSCCSTASVFTSVSSIESTSLTRIENERRAERTTPVKFKCLLFFVTVAARLPVEKKGEKWQERTNHREWQATAESFYGRSGHQ